MGDNRGPVDAIVKKVLGAPIVDFDAIFGFTGDRAAEITLEGVDVVILPAEGAREIPCEALLPFFHLFYND